MRNFTATVKERDVGQPCFVVLELKAEPHSRHVVLDLPKGTTIEDAEEVVRLLNRKVEKARIGPPDLGLSMDRIVHPVAPGVVAVEDDLEQLSYREAGLRPMRSPWAKPSRIRPTTNSSSRRLP